MIFLLPNHLLLEIAQFYSDLYMRRAFLSTILPLKPDVILFLGDYLDGGPKLSDKEWQESLSRFKHIFDLDKRERTKDIPFYYIPGNHDIGYAGHLFHKPEIIKRYEGTFGERNYKFTIGKVEFVVIDAQTIDGNLNDDTTSFTWRFVKGIREVDDQCTVNHQTKYATVKEHTLGTLSWQQGNLFPSFMLLSVGNFTHANVSSPESVVLSQLCFLPRQLFIYIWYIILLVITILALSFLPAYGIDIKQLFGHLIRSINKLVREPFLSGGKEKNEDENSEYEMMWDAEGGLHLIKKPCKAPLNVPKETSSTERVRAARKQTLQEQEAATKLEMSRDFESDVKNLPRSSKSFTRVMMQHCIRVLGMIMVIALVNVPLYMLMLFKDWAGRLRERVTVI